jgi:hypothetical protein
MACFVYSESNDIPIDFWNYINISDEPGKYQYLSLNDAKFNKITKRKGQGFFTKIQNKIFVVTCFHIVEQNNMKCIIYFYDKNKNIKFKNAKVHISIENFDIAVLELENEDEIECENVFSLDSSIHKLHNFELQKKVVINNIEADDKLLNFENKKIAGKYINIKEQKIVSLLLPSHEIPCINIQLCEARNYSYKGLSGSLVLYDNIPCGMIIRKDSDNTNKNNTRARSENENENESENESENVETNIVVMPLCLISYLINNFSIKKKKISTIFFSSLLGDFDIDDSIKNINTNIKTLNKINKTKYNCYVITDLHGITYQGIEHQGTKLEHKNKTLQINDIVFKINDQFINDDGKIYSDVLGSYVNFSTYCMIYSYFDDTFELLILRGDTILSYKIKSTNINDVIPYHIPLNPNFLYYEGFIFMELSEKLLGYFKDHNISIYGNINTIKCENDKIQKYVILVHINYNYLKSESKKGYEDLEKINFPYANNKIFILNKIGNENVTDLNSLKTILFKRVSDKQITYNYNMNYNPEEKNEVEITLNTSLTHHIKFYA